jgi:hypothetical protein
MITAIIVFSFFYLSNGFAAGFIFAAPDLLMRGRFVMMFAWPICMIYEDAKWMDPILMWAKGERVIEQSEWPIGTFRQTVLRRDGTDYQRIKGSAAMAKV